jgi:hypothetical protein
MAHSMNLFLDLSDRLLAAQRVIHNLRTRLADTEHTLRAHQRMQTGQDSDFYSSDQDTPGLQHRLELALARSHQ